MKATATTVLFLLLILGIASCSVFQGKHKTVYGSDILNGKQGLLDKDGNKTGEWKTYYDSGQLCEITYYKSGV